MKTIIRISNISDIGYYLQMDNAIYDDIIVNKGDTIKFITPIRLSPSYNFQNTSSPIFTFELNVINIEHTINKTIDGNEYFKIIYCLLTEKDMQSIRQFLSIQEQCKNIELEQ